MNPIPTESDSIPNGASLHIPERLGGYKVIRELGNGGMGVVYLATQLSLGRPVALKTIRPELSGNPGILSRFTREAFAAAQLSHHNIVQVYDLSQDKGVHFFSMEFVEGTTLDELLNQKKQLDFRIAISFGLQAARGLQFAHEHGLVHRDVKPANLLINKAGLIKIADLGLVKRAGEVIQDTPPLTSGNDNESSPRTTMAGESFGSPAFMAPEQCDDAAAVDNRADIYSLGCTLYMLLTGRPPHQGRNAQEVIKKHKTATVEPPVNLARSIPQELSNLILSMLSKRREQRPESLGVVINALEAVLNQGCNSANRYAEALLGCLHRFRAPVIARWRPWIILGLYAFALLLAVQQLVTLNLFVFACILGIVFTASITHVLVHGIFGQSYLFEQLRTLVVSSRWIDYGIWLLVVISLGMATVISDSYLLAAVAIVGGVSASLGVYFGLDKVVSSQRETSIKEAKNLLRQMRLEGMDETSIQQIVVQGCGEHWEEFFEELFGYRAKRTLRLWLETEKGNKATVKFAPWRDKVADALQSKLDQLEQSRRLSQFRKVELAKLQSEGLPATEARRKAIEEAERVAEHAAALKASAREYAFASNERRQNLKQMVALARAGTGRNRNRALARLLRIPGLLCGSRSRFALGAVLFILGMLWLRHNHVFDAINTSIASIDSLSDLKAIDASSLSRNATDTLARREDFQPLPFLPPLLGDSLGCVGCSIAGLLLIVTAPSAGLKGTALAILSAGIALIGPGLLVDYIPELPLSLSFVRGDELVVFALAAVIGFLSWWWSS